MTPNDSHEKIVIELTDRCPHTCLHCSSLSAPTAQQSLDPEQVRTLIEGAAAAGVRRIVFSGGEPLLVQELHEYVDLAVKQKMSVVIYTSGAVLSGAQAADVPTDLTKLLAPHVRYYLSVHSHDQDAHDAFMKAPGSWKRAMRFIQQVGAAAVDVHAVVSKYNCYSLLDLASTLDGLTIPKLRLLRLVRQGRADGTYDHLDPTSADWEYVAWQLRTLQKNRSRRLPNGLDVRLGAHLRGLRLNGAQYECTLDKQKLLVRPDGRFAVCPALKRAQLPPDIPEAPTLPLTAPLGTVLTGDWRQKIADLKAAHGESICPARSLELQTPRSPGADAPDPLSDLALVRYLLANVGRLSFPPAETRSVLGVLQDFVAHRNECECSLFRYASLHSDADQTTSLLKLWLAAMRGAIHVLKRYDLRENPAAHNAALPDRDIDPPDIGDIAVYYRAAVDFESVLYGVDPWYRDHFAHAIRVWLLGLKFCFENQSDLRFPELAPKGAETANTEYFQACEFYAAFTLAALTHDLGYPVEKVAHLNDAVARIVEATGGADWEPVRIALSPTRQDAAQQLLHFLSSTLKFQRDGRVPEAAETQRLLMERAARQKSLTGVADLYGLYTVDHLTASLRTQWSYHQKFTNSLEESRHGILSALLLARKLRYFQEGEFTLDPTHQFSVEEARQFVIRREILRAVAGHTCPAIYLLHSLDLNAILFFADEIQEWGRPSFRELYASRSAADTPSVHVAKYTKDAVEYRVRAEGTVDELAALRWSLSAGRKIVDRLRSAPDASDRRFSVLWTLEWKTAGEEAWFQLRVPGSKPDDGRRSSAVCKKGAKDVDAQKYLDELLTGEKLAAVASRLREALRA